MSSGRCSTLKGGPRFSNSTEWSLITSVRCEQMTDKSAYFPCMTGKRGVGWPPLCMSLQMSIFEELCMGKVTNWELLLFVPLSQKF